MKFGMRGKKVYRFKEGDLNIRGFAFSLEKKELSDTSASATSAEWHQSGTPPLSLDGNCTHWRLKRELDIRREEIIY